MLQPITLDTTPWEIPHRTVKVKLIPTHTHIQTHERRLVSLSVSVNDCVRLCKCLSFSFRISFTVNTVSAVFLKDVFACKAIVIIFDGYLRLEDLHKAERDRQMDRQIETETDRDREEKKVDAPYFTFHGKCLQKKAGAG